MYVPEEEGRGNVLRECGTGGGAGEASYIGDGEAKVYYSVTPIVGNPFRWRGELA